jgi:capsular exopolysaccharide synthesis family protein
VPEGGALGRWNGARGSEPSPSITKRINAINLLNALRKRWLLAACLGVVIATAVGASVWFFLPPAKQMAYARLLIRDKGGDIFQQREYQTEFQSYLREQIAHLKSRFVINAALRQPDVANLLVVRDHGQFAVDWLVQRLKVDTLEAPQIPRVSLVLDDPDEAKLIIGAITDQAGFPGCVENGAYFKEVVSREKDERLEFLKKLEIVSDAHKVKLDNLKKAIKTIADDNPGAVNPRTAAVLIELVRYDLGYGRADLRKINQELQPLQFEEMLQAKQEGARIGAALFASCSIFGQEGAGPIAILSTLNPFLGRQDAGGSKADTSFLDQYLENDQNVRQLRLEILKSEKTLNEATKKFVRADDPALQRMREKLKSQKDELDSLRDLLRPSAEKYLRGVSHVADPSQRQYRIASLKKQKEDLEKELEELTQKLVKLNKDALSVDDKRDDKDLEAKLANYLAELREKFTVDLDSPPRVRLLERATIERVEESPRKLRFAGLSALGALALTLLGVSFLEFRLHRVDSPESVVRTLGVEVVGTVPACPLRNGQLANGDAKAVYWQHVLTDSIDAARTMLVHRARSDGPSVVMITSAVSGEGKTSLASHMAVSMVRAGYKTLLIDCDFRNPALHQLFEQPLQPGFCELLRDECNLAEAQRPSSVNGLTFISAGRIDQAALRLLARARGHELFQQFRSDFEFIIVDSSPLLPVPDGLLVAQLVDGVLISLMCDVSRLPRVYEACSRLSSLGVTVLGAVVNGTANNFSDYDKRYGYAGQSQTGETA